MKVHLPLDIFLSIRSDIPEFQRECERLFIASFRA
jgi:hypothetical protein